MSAAMHGPPVPVEIELMQLKERFNVQIMETENLVKRHEAVLRCRDQENAQLRRENHSLRIQRDDLLVEKNEAKDDHSHLKAMYRKLQDYVARENLRILSLETSRKEKEEAAMKRTSELETSLKRKTEENDSYELQVARLSQENTDLLKESEIMKEDMSWMRECLNYQEENNTDARMEDLKKELEESKRRARMWKWELEMMKRQQRDATEEKAENVVASKFKTRANTSDVTETITSLEGQIETLSIENKSLEDSVNETIQLMNLNLTIFKGLTAKKEREHKKLLNDQVLGRQSDRAAFDFQMRTMRDAVKKEFEKMNKDHSDVVTILKFHRSADHIVFNKQIKWMEEAMERKEKEHKEEVEKIKKEHEEYLAYWGLENFEKEEEEYEDEEELEDEEGDADDWEIVQQ